jgi:hypothetical protein
VRGLGIAGLELAVRIAIGVRRRCRELRFDEPRITYSGWLDQYHAYTELPCFGAENLRERFDAYLLMW